MAGTRFWFGMGASTFVVEDTDVLGLSKKIIPYSIKMNIDGIGHYTRQRYWYYDFELNLGYLDGTNLENIKSLKNGSFTFYPDYINFPSTSHLCILDRDFTFDSEFYLNGSYNANIIKLRLMEVDG